MIVMDIIIDGLESRKNGDKYHDHVIDDAISNINRAQEALDEGLKDPEKWWKDSYVNCKTFMYLMPFIILLQQRISQHNPCESEENSQPSQAGDQEVEDNSEPVFPFGAVCF